jgi:2-haloacid dehalogenase
MEFTIQELNLELSERGRQRLMDAYESLRPYREAATALATLRDAGHTIVAFTNGVEASARTVLANADLLPLLEDVISVDAVQTFKPSPVVYRYLAERLGRPLEETMLVSGNTWDVVGARAAGLQAAWVRRNPRTVYDPWGLPPNLIVSDLNDLAAKLADAAVAGAG